METWPLNSMAKTFLCPGLVIRMPAARGTRVYRIDYCWMGICEVTDLKTSRRRMLLTSNISEVGILIGRRYKQKV